MVLSAKLLPRGQAARLDFHAHSLRLFQSGMPGDIAHTVHAAGENRFAHYGPPLALPICIDENEGNT
jgi:hypothetical protein